MIRNHVRHETLPCEVLISFTETEQTVQQKLSQHTGPLFEDMVRAE